MGSNSQSTYLDNDLAEGKKAVKQAFRHQHNVAAMAWWLQQVQRWALRVFGFKCLSLHSSGQQLLQFS